MLLMMPTSGASFGAVSSKPALLLKADAPALDAHARAVTSIRSGAELLPAPAAPASAPASAVELFLRPPEEPLEVVKQWARLAGALANNRRLKFVAATSLKSPAAPTPGLIRNWLICGQPGVHLAAPTVSGSSAGKVLFYNPITGDAADLDIDELIDQARDQVGKYAKHAHPPYPPALL